MYISVTSIGPFWNRNRQEETSPPPEAIDSKIVGLVLARIGHLTGGLLPSLVAPQIVIDLHPPLEQSKAEHAPKQKLGKKKHRIYKLRKKKGTG